MKKKKEKHCILVHDRGVPSFKDIREVNPCTGGNRFSLCGDSGCVVLWHKFFSM